MNKRIRYKFRKEYDFAGRAVKQCDVAGDYATFEYDALGRLETVSEKRPIGDLFVYDGQAAPFLSAFPSVFVIASPRCKINRILGFVKILLVILP